MPKALYAALFLATSVCTLYAQNQAAPRQPITLPGFEPDRPPAQKAVQSLIQKGKREERAGDYNSAVKTFQDALQKLRSTPEMKQDEDEVLVGLGRSYIGARRLEEAVTTFSLLLGQGTDGCRAGVAEVEYCAEAQNNIGFVDMQKGNFSEAVPLLRNSMANYARAVSGSDPVEYRMTKLKQQAETETMLAGALLRTGHRQGAIDSLNHAISQLSTVERNRDIQEAIRTSAGKSLEDARKALALATR